MILSIQPIVIDCVYLRARVFDDINFAADLYMKFGLEHLAELGLDLDFKSLNELGVDHFDALDYSKE